MSLSSPDAANEEIVIDPIQELIGQTLSDVARRLTLATLHHFKGDRAQTATALGSTTARLGILLKQYQTAGYDVPPAPEKAKADKEPRRRLHADELAQLYNLGLTAGQIILVPLFEHYKKTTLQQWLQQERLVGRGRGYVAPVITPELGEKIVAIAGPGAADKLLEIERAAKEIRENRERLEAQRRANKIPRIRKIIVTSKPVDPAADNIKYVTLTRPGKIDKEGEQASAAINATSTVVTTPDPAKKKSEPLPTDPALLAAALERMKSEFANKKKSDTTAMVGPALRTTFDLDHLPYNRFSDDDPRYNRLQLERFGFEPISKIRPLHVSGIFWHPETGMMASLLKSGRVSVTTLMVKQNGEAHGQNDFGRSEDYVLTFGQKSLTIVAYHHNEPFLYRQAERLHRLMENQAIATAPVLIPCGVDEAGSITFLADEMCRDVNTAKSSVTTYTGPLRLPAHHQCSIKEDVAKKLQAAIRPDHIKLIRNAIATTRQRFLVTEV